MTPSRASALSAARRAQLEVRAAETTAAVLLDLDIDAGPVQFIATSRIILDALLRAESPAAVDTDK